MASVVLKTAALVAATATSQMNPLATAPAWLTPFYDDGACSILGASSPNVFVPGLSIVTGGVSGDWGVTLELTAAALAGIADANKPYTPWIQIIYSTLSGQAVHTADKSTVLEGAKLYAPFSIPTGISAQDVKVTFNFGVTPDKTPDPAAGYDSYGSSEPASCNASYVIAKFDWAGALDCELNEDEIKDETLPKCPGTMAISRDRPAQCYLAEPASLAEDYPTLVHNGSLLSRYSAADVTALMATSCPTTPAPAAQKAWCTLPGCVKGFCSMTSGSNVGTCNCGLNNPDGLVGPLCGDKPETKDEEEEQNGKKPSAAFGAVASAALALVAAVAFF